MKKATLPAGEDARRTWRRLNCGNPKVADLFAAAVWRYAETGESEPPDGVFEEDWADAQAEVERIEAARAAAQKGGAAGRGISRNAGNRNASKSIAESIAESKAESKAESIPTRAPEDEDDDDDEEEDKNENPKTVEHRTSDTGIFLPSKSSDFAGWAWMQEDPVTVALGASEEGKEKAGIYGAKLKAFKEAFGKEAGVRAFVEVCVQVQSEFAAGENGDNPGKILSKRLNDRLAAPPTPKANPAPKPSKVEEAAPALSLVAPLRSQVAETPANAATLPPSKQGEAPETVRATAAPVEVAEIVEKVADPFKREPLRPLTPEEEEAKRRENAAKWEAWKRAKREAAAPAPTPANPSPSKSPAVEVAPAAAPAPVEDPERAKRIADAAKRLAGTIATTEEAAAEWARLRWGMAEEEAREAAALFVRNRKPAARSA